MADFTAKALGEIKKLGATHIWYTGIIEHATQTDYRRYNIRPDHPAIVKGKAGSPYAIKDYYDVDPDLAKDVPERMREFENLVQRTGLLNWEQMTIRTMHSALITTSIIFRNRNCMDNLI